MKALLDDLQTIWSMVENATDEEIELMNSVRARVEELERDNKALRDGMDGLLPKLYLHLESWYGRLPEAMTFVWLAMSDEQRAEIEARNRK